MYVDPSNARVMSKDMGQVLANRKADETGLDDGKTLENARFIIGDFVDVAIFDNSGRGRGPPHAQNGMRRPSAGIREDRRGSPW